MNLQSVRDAAVTLQVPVATFERWVQEKLVPFSTFGPRNIRRIDVDSITPEMIQAIRAARAAQQKLGRSHGTEAAKRKRTITAPIKYRTEAERVVALYWSGLMFAEIARETDLKEGQVIAIVRAFVPACELYGGLLERDERDRCDHCKMYYNEDGSPRRVEVI